MSMDDGESGQVEATAYCMGKSIEARNNKEMNEGYGYNSMSDLANTPKPPVAMKAAKSNPQMGPTALGGKYKAP